MKGDGRRCAGSVGIILDDDGNDISYITGDRQRDIGDDKIKIKNYSVMQPLVVCLQLLQHASFLFIGIPPRMNYTYTILSSLSLFFIKIQCSLTFYIHAHTRLYYRGTFSRFWFLKGPLCHGGGHFI